MIQILRKENWILNPNDKIVNSILKRVEANNGECPCANPGETPEDRKCPCKEYRENNCCHCGLYLKSLNKIKLPNRDGLDLYLQELSDGKYLLKGDNTGYMRLIGTVGDIKAIDPPGGPYLSVGGTVGRRVIKKIVWRSKGYTIEFENESK